MPQQFSPRAKKHFRIVAVVLGAVVLPLVLLIALSPEVRWYYGNYLPAPTLTIEGAVLHLDGDLNSGSYTRIKGVLERNSAIDTLVFHTMPGSTDEERVLELGRFLHTEGYHTALTSESRIASGATHLFLAGVVRSAPPSAHIGVHAWRQNNGTEAQKLHKKHPMHDLYLSYYQDIEMPEEFYWFSIEAASPSEVYFLTEEDIERFGILTE